MSREQQIADEHLIRDGFAELVRDKPDLGAIDLDAVRAGGAGSAARHSAVLWPVVAAAVVLIVGLAGGIWGGVLQGAGQGTTAAGPAGPGAPALPLVGTRWVASSVAGVPAVPDGQGEFPTLVLDDGSDVQASDGCNGIGGTYRLEGNTLSFGQLLTTAIGCSNSEEWLRQSTAFSDALQATSGFLVSGAELTLTDSDGRPVLVFLGDAQPSTSSTPADAVLIRVRNDSGVTFDRVQINFYDRLMDYGSLAAGATSEYLAVETAYRYACIRVTVAGSPPLVLQPTDYVGETPLEPGRYTYALSQDGENLDLNFDIDP